MALDPRILLQVRGPDFAGAIARGQAAGRAQAEFPLLQQQRQQALNLGNLQIDAQTQAIQDAERARGLQRLQFLDAAAAQLAQTPIEQRAQMAVGMSQQLSDLGIDAESFLSGADLTDQGISGFRASIAPMLSAIPQEQAAFQFGSTLTLEDSDGNQYTQTQRRNPTSGEIESILTPIGNAPANPDGGLEVVGSGGETPTERRERIEREAVLEVETAQKKKQAELAESRKSEIIKEFGDRNRQSARNQTRVNQALQLASTATQGLTGEAKLKLASILPGIDVTDEAVLDQSLKQLAVDQLQAFKGPTTDFEFGVVQNTTGELGDPASANIARLKALKRDDWFKRREFDQLQNHLQNNGDPDAFRFNFGEVVETGKGNFTLQDIQDTAVANNMTIEEVLKRLNE